MAKPAASRKPTPSGNTRDIEVTLCAEKETQANLGITVQIGSSLPLRGEEAKQRLTVQTDLSKTRVQARGTTLPIYRLN